MTASRLQLFRKKDEYKKKITFLAILTHLQDKNPCSFKDFAWIETVQEE